MRKIVKRPLARQDLKQIWRYSFKEWGEAQADKYFAEIEAGILKLQAHPHLGKSREDLRAGYYAVRVNQHVIYYMLTPSLPARGTSRRGTSWTPWPTRIACWRFRRWPSSSTP